MNQHTETIVCPECETLQAATVLHSWPWWTYVHKCSHCRYIILESEWQRPLKALPFISFNRNYSPVAIGQIRLQLTQQLSDKATQLRELQREIDCIKNSLISTGLNPNSPFIQIN